MGRGCGARWHRSSYVLLLVCGNTPLTKSAHFADAIQLAKLLGFTVVATSSPKDFDLLKFYGATSVYSCCYPSAVARRAAYLLSRVQTRTLPRQRRSRRTIPRSPSVSTRSQGKAPPTSRRRAGVSADSLTISTSDTSPSASSGSG
jgi:hypothetical protein